MTNGDMIRQMSDEELAYLIWKDPGNLFYKGPMETLVWLSEEATYDRTGYQNQSVRLLPV